MFVAGVVTSAVRVKLSVVVEKNELIAWIHVKSSAERPCTNSILCGVVFVVACSVQVEHQRATDKRVTGGWRWQIVVSFLST